MFGGGVADCSTASYSAWTVVVTDITEALGGDDDYRLCVVGRDAAQNAPATATQFTWTKDTAAPTATLSGTPADPASDTTLNVTVAGTDVTEYQFDVVGGGAADCSTATYSAWTVVATPITEALGSDDDYCLCVVGRDAVGNAQATATQFAWTKDTAALTATHKQ